MAKAPLLSNSGIGNPRALCWGFRFGPAIREPRPKSDLGAGPREPSSKRTQQPKGSAQLTREPPKVFLGTSGKSFGAHFQAASQPLKLESQGERCLA
jgi:hypothetical protein